MGDVVADAFERMDHRFHFVEHAVDDHGKIRKRLVGIAVLISGGFGISKGVDQFMLPSCGSDRTTNTLKSIFKGKNVEVSDLTEIKTLTDTYSEKTCQAHVSTPSEQANIDYRIYWDGWSASIIITKVN